MNEKLSTTVTELEASWSFDDLMIAHELLDVLEEAEAKQVDG